MQDFAASCRQGLRDGPPPGGQEGVETAMEIKVDPMLQGVPVDPLVPAHGGQEGLPVPYCNIKAFQLM